MLETEKCDSVRQSLQHVYDLIREHGLVQTSDKTGSPEPTSTDTRRSTSPSTVEPTRPAATDRAQILQGYSGSLGEFDDSRTTIGRQFPSFLDLPASLILHENVVDITLNYLIVIREYPTTKW